MNIKHLIIYILILTSIHSFCQTITHTEMLGRPMNNGISIEAIFNSAVEVRVLYGTTTGVYKDSTNWLLFNTDSVGDAVAVINLTNLNSDTKYYYKLQYRSQARTQYTSRPEHTFHTARPAGESFVFDIQADPHMDAATDTALYRLCLQNQLSDNPDFMIDLGDFLMTDKLKNKSGIVPQDTVPYRCNLLRSYYETINHSVPLFTVLGNHEGEEGWYLNGTANNVAVWDTKYRKKYFIH